MSRPDALAQLREARAAVVAVDAENWQWRGPILLERRKNIWDRWHAAVRAFWDAK